MLWSLARKTLEKWSDDPGPRFAAALAFYTALTIVPLVVLTIMVSVSMMDEDSIRSGLQHHIGDLIGESAGNGLFQLINQWRSAGSPLRSGLVALGVFIIGALQVMDQLQDALNSIWGLKPKQPSGILNRVRRRFASLSWLLGIAFLLLASLTLSAWLGVVLQSVLGTAGGPVVLREGLGVAVSLGIVSALFAMIYKWVPQAQVAWSDVRVGAAITGVLYILGSKLIVVYLAHNALVAFYGGAGALVLVLLWAYYASQIFLFGAAVIAVYASHHGSPVRPTDDAVAVHAASEGDASADES
ncbi:MAG: YihY/virulence factor BrkB family protein [Nitrospira sp.]